ncbi:MAG: exodeoxyribonuclease III, partial [Comamonadaceae bacterium]
AILSRTPLSDPMHGFADVELDAQARLVCGRIAGVQVICVYVPNGLRVGDEKYAYKQRWLAALRGFLHGMPPPPQGRLVCGDINIAPRPQDVAQPDAWEQTVLFHPAMRQAFAQLLQCGLVDVFAAQHPQGGLYSWWDYRRLGFAKNNGLRIDHILASPKLAARCTATSVDRDERKGEQPSDHAPVLAEFAL